jgi:nicotinamide-nucleotide amidase
MDTEDLAARIGELLRGRTVACAESCTAGLVAQSFAATEGSMSWFRGGVVAYQRESKETVLGIRHAPLVSPEVAHDMACGIARLMDADVTVSVTGAAGPDPLDGAAPGTVVVGVYVDGRASTSVHHVPGSPPEVCGRARDVALEQLERALRAAAR